MYHSTNRRALPSSARCTSAVVLLVASSHDEGDRLATRLANAVLHAPHILPVEVDSALRGLVAGRVLTEAEAAAARQQAGRMPIDLWAWESLGERAWEMGSNLSTYDAGYVALAEHIGATLVTADARLARAPGVRCAIEVFG
ncbi:MAG: type II toxin-antitoxin system VapC family toxin [Microbacterium hominis]|jgi:predicted nucleic acid-binding protein|uniref:type II toxin-antitoxin system VapC family toxin n=1 Tax=Microbacterium aurum TaxID=36805 RepID=UPI00248E6BDD|nr:type II toxin-antitoxin system VapC family toxin [Microbacterium aurum]MBZ6373020.1 type II toxin-antitoxin system VapC family toxin [Microbacterium hominis]